jgi:class II lanthipeptide synthase
MPPALPPARRLLSDQDRAQIAHGAAGLFECLDGRGAAAAASPQQAQTLLNAWQEAFAPGDPRALERRLAWDGLDAARVLQTLTATLASRSQPESDWTAWLPHFLEAAAELAQIDSPELAAELERVSPSTEPPFLEIWVSMARAARKALAGEGALVDGIHADALAALERSLISDCAAAGELALFSLFRSFEGAPERPGSRYSAFVRSLLEGGLADVFRDYPVLARQLARLAATWVDSSLEFLKRLRRDQDALAALFGVPALGTLRRLAPGLSDRHAGGRRVGLLTFAAGIRVVYKPRDLGIEAAFQDFVAWLASRGPHVPRPLRVLEREGYGWVECVDQEPFLDRQQVADYFRRAGTLLCVLHVLRGIDAHQENVVATRRGPILIDGETLLQPVDRAEDRDSRSGGLLDGAAQDVRRSCLSSSLLTLLDIDGDGECYDVGGLMPALARTPTAARAWRALRSDALHFVRGREVQPGVQNQVVLDGVVQRPEWFAAELVAGFAAAYRLFLTERSSLLDSQGPLARFAGRRSRLLFRPSDQYGVYLHGLSGPRYQKSGFDRSLGLETLSRVFRHEEKQPLLWPLVADERLALEALDVPRYTLPVDACVLTTASGARVSDHLVRSGLEAVRAGLREMSEADLARQLELLASALEEAAPPPATASGRAESGDGASLHEDPGALFMRAAEILGDAILGRSRGASDRSLSWGESDSRGPHGRYDLYHGQAGIALFLAALAKITQQGRFFHAAASLRLSFENMPEKPGASPQVWPELGACSGLGSVVYALATTGRLLKDGAWTDLALRSAREISPARIARDTQLDLAGGAAGALLALLALEDETGEAWIRERIESCVEHLLETQTAAGDDAGAWPGHDGRLLSGFAHGAAGIAYALGRAHALVPNERLAGAVARAHRFERRLFSGALRNWPPAREGGAVLMTAWCYGAPGIGMARTLGLGAFRDEAILEEIRVACETTAATPASRADHLCCGNMGRSEALLIMGRGLGQAQVVAEGAALATRLAQRVCAQGRFGVRTEGFEHRTFQPGFFRGLAGVGYQLLRGAAPSRLPSVLGFESVRAVEP